MSKYSSSIVPAMSRDVISEISPRRGLLCIFASRIQIWANCHWLVRSHILTWFTDQILTTHNSPTAVRLNPRRRKKFDLLPSLYRDLLESRTIMPGSI